MNSEFKEIFSQVRAEEALKHRTMVFLAGKTRGYTRVGSRARRYPLYAAACLLMVLFGGRWLYFTPVAEISIDINPSLELSVNRLDQVIAVRDFNEDGRTLVQGLDVKYKTYTEAIEEILSHDRISALLSGDEVMSITVSGPDGPRSARMLSEVEACAAGHGTAHCYFAPREEAAAAHEMGLSCGRYRAFVELQRLDPDVTPEAVREMTMREIWEQINRLSPYGGSVLPPYGGQGNGHHGHGAAHKRRRRASSPALVPYSSSKSSAGASAASPPPILISCHFSLVISSCRGLEPSKGPTMPFSSNWSTSRAARA